MDAQTAVFVSIAKRFGSQHRIPKPLFFWVFWVYAAIFGLSARGHIFVKAPVTKIRVSGPARTALIKALVSLEKLVYQTFDISNGAANSS